jgi:hypothetical protein
MNGWQGYANIAIWHYYKKKPAWAFKLLSVAVHCSILVYQPSYSRPIVLMVRFTASFSFITLAFRDR